MKNLILVIIGLVLILGFIFFGKGTTSSIEPALVVGEINPVDHIKGNASSTVVLIEYSDFQCPACRSYYPVLREVFSEFGGDIAFVYRHFPLSNIHFNADFAARASEAASLQGKFWEMHDLLFEKQDEWASATDIEKTFINYATLIGLDTEKFKVDWRSKDIKDLVNEYKKHAIKAGLQGTPTFYINGKKIDNPKSKEEFEVLIRSALQEKS